MVGIMINAIRMIYPHLNFDLYVGEDANNSAYTKSDRRRAISSYLKHKSVGEAEKEVGISRNTIREWVKKYLGAGI